MSTEVVLCISDGVVVNVLHPLTKFGSIVVLDLLGLFIFIVAALLPFWMRKDWHIGRTRKLFCYPFSIIRFRADPSGHFDTSNFTFTPFWLENVYSHPVLEFWGIWPLKLAAMLTIAQAAYLCAETRQNRSTSSQIRLFTGIKQGGCRQVGFHRE